MNARAEIGDDGVKIGQVDHVPSRKFVQMTWSYDQSASAVLIHTSPPSFARGHFSLRPTVPFAFDRLCPFLDRCLDIVR